MDEYEFCISVLGLPFCWETLEDAFGDRPKLVKAFRKLLQRAGHDLEQLDIRIFAPSNENGAFLKTEVPMIYLSPSLENESQAQVDYSVAHEFAHAVVEARGSTSESSTCLCGKGEDCDCIDCECEGCRNYELETTADDYKSPLEYVNSPSEYEADTLVIDWGYKIPAWKAKLRKAREISQIGSRANGRESAHSQMPFSLYTPEACGAVQG